VVCRPEFRYINGLARTAVEFVAVALGICLLTERPAHAYIDPGTGSLIYQTALTVILGLGLVLRRSRASIVRFVKRLAGRDATPSDSR
jgi:hypothetical protein